MLTVIVPTYDDWIRLADCIEALRNQSLDDSEYEILIVNNLPANQPPDSLYLPRNARILEESKPGSYAARNLGIQNAAGHIIAFTDSDCIPDRNWLANGLQIMATGSNRVAGQIQLKYGSEKLNWAEAHDKAFAFPQRRYARKGVSTTANLFVRRKLFDEVGLFDEYLYSGGDIEWNRRALHRGYSIQYGVACLVHHPARASLSKLFAKRRRVVGGLHAQNGIRALSLLRAMVPPIDRLFQLSDREITSFQALQAFIIRYLLNLYGVVVTIQLYFGQQAERE